MKPESTDSGSQPFRIRLARPILGQEESEAVRRVLTSGILTNGPATRAFEEAFASRHEVKEAVAVANGTVALAAIYLALGIGPGDEVVVPSMTFVSTATAVRHVGANPVFADVDPETFTIAPAAVAACLTARTRAIVAVHYGGQAGDLDELHELASERGLALVEDAAQAHGSSYRGRPVGGIGDAAMFSFTPTKNITTGEGGIVTTNDPLLAQKVRLLRNHGQTSIYEHTALGFNWRMTEMQAAIGLVQLGRLETILQRKRANAALMNDLLANLPGVHPPATRYDRDHTYMLYTILVDGARNEVMRSLHSAGIEGRLYFPPAHRQVIFADERWVLPITDDLSGRMISVPIHAGLTAQELSEIARHFSCWAEDSANSHLARRPGANQELVGDSRVDRIGSKNDALWRRNPLNIVPTNRYGLVDD